MEPGSSPQPSRSTACTSALDGAARITVEVHDEQELPVDPSELCRVALGALADLRLGGANLDVTLVDRDRMAELNAEHMGSDGPTDVLAFPLDGPDLLDQPVGLRDAGEEREPTHAWAPPTDAGPVHLGDVVVCPSVAEAQARAGGTRLPDELALLVVHGVLHVLGHDHADPDERDRMFSLTDDLLRRPGARRPDVRRPGGAA